MTGFSGLRSRLTAMRIAVGAATTLALTILLALMRRRHSSPATAPPPATGHARNTSRAGPAQATNIRDRGAARRVHRRGDDARITRISARSTVPGPFGSDIGQLADVMCRRVRDRGSNAMDVVSTGADHVCRYIDESVPRGGQ